jgi:hypothetical protein
MQLHLERALDVKESVFLVKIFARLLAHSKAGKDMYEQTVF